MEGTNGDQRPTDIDVHRAILVELRRRSLTRVISTNAVVAEIRKMVVSDDVSDRDLARLVTETAACLGLIPVYNVEMQLA